MSNPDPNVGAGSRAEPESEQPSRRDFLRDTGSQACGMVLAIGGGNALLGGVSTQEGKQEGKPQEPAPSGQGEPHHTEVAGTSHGYQPEQHAYAYVVDIDKCIGCGSCVRA
jgi:NAD-dependent dihydropyrimidine dehydrogenase PreA subunit